MRVLSIYPWQVLILQKYFQKAQKDVNEGRKSRARYDDYDYERPRSLYMQKVDDDIRSQSRQSRYGYY